MSARIAIVHDYLVQYGGAERVVEALHDLWPDAPVFTSMYEPDALPDVFRTMDVRTSFMQRLPSLRKHYKLGLPLYPIAMAALDVSGYDAVVSSSSGWAHGVTVESDAAHVVYCHTPARWLYRTDSYVPSERVPAAPLLPALRRWDRRSALRPTEYLANSDTTRRRIFKQYRRAARVVHPPVDTSRFSIGEPEDFYLCASRLLAYKRIELAIEACNRVGARLLVAGTGPFEPSLRRVAGPRTEFLGHVSDAELADLLSRCRALIVPAEEDFCITAVEAMASGRPVVGFAGGGLLETVERDRTGVFFATPTPETLVAALAHLDRLELSPDAIRTHALRFDVRRFQATMQEIVEDALARSDGQHGARRTDETSRDDREQDFGIAAGQ